MGWHERIFQLSLRWAVLTAWISGEQAMGVVTQHSHYLVTQRRGQRGLTVRQVLADRSGSKPFARDFNRAELRKVVGVGNEPLYLQAFQRNGEPGLTTSFIMRIVGSSFLPQVA